MFQRRNRGFSLVELMIVVAIIGILIAVLLPELGDMATKSRVSTAQRSMSAIRDGIIRYQAAEGRTLDSLNWLIPKYMTELKPDPWGNAYSLVAVDGIIMSYGPDGKANSTLPNSPDNRDNIITSYLPALAISDAQQTTDVNGNGLLDNGDVITIYFSKMPNTPATANATGTDFVWKGQYTEPGTPIDYIFTAATAGSTAIGKDPATNLPVNAAAIGQFATQSPDGTAAAGALGGKYDYLNLALTRSTTAAWEADLYLRFNNTVVTAPFAATKYADKRQNLAQNLNYNVKVKRFGEY